MWIYLVICVLLGIITGFIAKNKGHSFIVWWAYGAILIIPALPHALLLKPDVERRDRKKKRKGMKKCPYCGEWTTKNSEICLFCGKNLTSLTKAYDNGWHDLDLPKDQQEKDPEDPDLSTGKTGPY